MKERDFQVIVRGRIKAEVPDAIILKNDPTFMQGIPDLLVLHGTTWAALECKASMAATVQPNQMYYVERLNRMGYATFVYPENVEKVLEDLAWWFNRVGVKKEGDEKKHFNDFFTKTIHELRENEDDI